MFKYVVELFLYDPEDGKFQFMSQVSFIEVFPILVNDDVVAGGHVLCKLAQRLQ